MKFDPKAEQLLTNSTPAEQCDRRAAAAKAPCTMQMERYSTPILLEWSMDIMAGMFKDEAAAGQARPRPKHFEFNLATARKVTLSVQPDERYNDGGAFTLVDGITAGTNRVNTEWLGWRQGVVITVDLGRDTTITSFGIGSLNEPHSWIHLPEQVTVSVSSDGKTFNELGTANTAIAGGANRYRLRETAQGRYVRFAVKHRGKIPEGFPGAGNPAWMFLDEIEVR
jgi:hexosaminidase